MHQTTGELTIRAANRTDRLAICTLLQQAWHSAGGVRWEQIDAIELGCGALLTCRDGRAIGFVLLDLRALPVARLSAVAIADGEQVEGVWGELWPAAEGYLHERGAEIAYYVGEAPWLLDLLQQQGFAQVNTLVTYEKTPGGSMLAGNHSVRIRPARLEDVSQVEAIDAVSFPVVWRYTRPMIENTLKSGARLVVAELDRRPVGYELSTLDGNSAQIVRLAVLPEYRQQAIGSRLMAEALSAIARCRIRRVSLSTQSDNLPAQKLYNKFGFRHTGDELPVLEKRLAR